MQGSPSVLKKAVAAFADYCSHRRYRAVIGNVAPADGHRGRMEETTRRRKEVSRKTLGLRRDDHRASSEQ